MIIASPYGSFPFTHFLPTLHQTPPFAIIHIETGIMPTNPTTTSKSETQSSKKPKPTVDSIYAGFGGWENFLHSYGLKPYNDEDVEEGEKIAEMLEGDLEDWGECAKT